MTPYLTKKFHNLHPTSPTRSSTKSTKKTSKENNKKAVKSEKSKKSDLENESSQEEEESSVKKGSSASSAQSGSGSVSGSGSGSGSGGSSNSSSSSSNSSSEAELEPGEAEDLLVETEMPKKKPAPIRRASETLKTDANKIKELEEDSASNLTPSHIAEGSMNTTKSLYGPQSDSSRSKMIKNVQSRILQEIPFLKDDIKGMFNIQFCNVLDNYFL